MINLPTTQKIIYIQETLSEYYKKVNGKKNNIFHILDLADVEAEINNKCPICGSSECASFHKYYKRQVVDINGVYYKDFPIARFLCRNRKTLTFSLLPYQLIPYRKYSLELIILMLSFLYQGDTSIALDHLVKINIFSVTYSYLANLSKLLQESLEKILFSGHYDDLNKIIAHENNEKDRLENFIAFSKGFNFAKGNWITKGACALSYDFYLRSNGRFLFGTPSQLRGRGS
jgi:hypothetical protein